MGRASIEHHHRYTVASELCLITPIRSQVSFVLFVEPFRLLQTNSDCNVITVKATAAVGHVSRVMMAILFRPILSFRPRAFIISRRTRQLTNRFRPIQDRLTNRGFSQPIIRSMNFPTSMWVALIFRSGDVSHFHSRFSGQSIVFRFTYQEIKNNCSSMKDIIQLLSYNVMCVGLAIVVVPFQDPRQQLNPFQLLLRCISNLFPIS